MAKKGRESIGTRLVAAGLLVAMAFCVGGCGQEGPSLSDVSYWRTRFQSGEGMDTVAAGGAAAVPLLNTLLGDAQESVVSMAALTVQKIGEPAAATVPAMLAALDRFPGQPNVVEAIGAMKASAVPSLVPLLASADAKKQEVALELLTRIGPHAEKALEPLMKLVEGGASVDLKKKALVAIGGIGTPAKPVVERLLAVANAHDDLKNDAYMAIKRIQTDEKVQRKGGNR